MSLTNTVPATDKPFKHTAISAFAALSAMTVFTTTLLTALPSACAADVVRPQAAPVRLTEPSAAKPAANPAFQRAPAAVPGKFVRRSTEADLLRFPISAQHASRIAFTGGERIESAIWDQQDLDLKTDTAAGQIFVRPKREGEIVLYVTTESGETVSSYEIKNILQKCIDEEDKRHPLTDETLMNILNSKGYCIARRTVAKYREMLDIPVARLRKQI